MINPVLQDALGVYRVILPRVERVNPRAHDIFVKFGETFNREELYTFALGMVNEIDMEEINFFLEYQELYEAMIEFSTIIKDHYEFSLPEELRNDECFSLAIEDYNDEADIYVFTCEVPRSYAERKYGIDFNYLGKFFPGKT